MRLTDISVIFKNKMVKTWIHDTMSKSRKFSVLCLFLSWKEKITIHVLFYSIIVLLRPWKKKSVRSRLKIMDFYVSNDT